MFEGIDRTALLATGRSVHIAPATPGDAERVRAFYAALSDTSTYYRFFGIRRAIPESELRGIVAQDVPKHVSLLASIDDELIGLGEFIVGQNPYEAEVAFAVADKHHHEGVATLLLEDLALIARRCGLRRFVARTLPGNDAMRVVFHTVGLAEEAKFEDGVITVALDLASCEGLEAQAAMRRRHARSRSLDPVLAPEHVVVIGESPRGTAAARRVLGTLSAHFAGRVSTLPSPGDAPERWSAGLPNLDARPDVAVIAVDPQDVVAALTACGAAGVPAAIVICADPARVLAEAPELGAVAHRYGMRVIGPCLGLVVPGTGLWVLLHPWPVPPGSVALVAGSDAVAIALASESSRRRLGVSALVSLANSTDVTPDDLLCHWAEDPSTTVVLLDLEHEPQEGPAPDVAAAVGRVKPIAVLVEAGTRADDEMIDASGIIRVRTREELLDVGELCSFGPPPTGRRVAVLGDGTAPGDIDRCARRFGLQLATSPPLPSAARPDQVASAVAALVVRGETDYCTVSVSSMIDREAETTVQQLAGLDRGGVVVVLVDDRDQPGSARSLPILPTQERALAAIGRAAAWGAWRNQG